MSVYWFSSKQIDNYWEGLQSVEQLHLRKVSVKATLPYWADQKEYKSTCGSFKLNGIVYRALYQKYSGDSLHFLVVEDHLTYHLNQSVKDWVKNTTESSSQEQGKLHYMKSVTKDYRPGELIDFHAPYLLRALMIGNTPYSFSLHPFISEADTPPPQV